MGWFRKKNVAPVLVSYGRYAHRPTLTRAIQLITGHAEISDLILNGKVVDNYNQRLEAGSYTMSSVKLNTTWTFFVK